MSNILVTGSGSGLGKLLFEKLKEHHNVIGYDIKDGHDIRKPEILTNELDVLINCASINGIDYLENLDDQLWDDVISTNVTGMMKMCRAYLPQLIKSKGTILNIVSNAATVPLTASICYNVSKGAQKIMTAQMAKELGNKYGITVFSVSPNKLAGTGMSKYIEKQVCEKRGWTEEYAREYQLKALLTHEETDPAELADFIVYLLQDKKHHKYLAGCDLNYGK